MDSNNTTMCRLITKELVDQIDEFAKEGEGWDIIILSNYLKHGLALGIEDDRTSIGNLIEYMDVLSESLRAGEPFDLSSNSNLMRLRQRILDDLKAD